MSTVKTAATVALLAALLGVAGVQAQTPWANWDQGKAFDEAQARVKAGKDSLPGVRTCFWRYGPSSGDPYINIAYPDAAAFYWGAVFSVPKGSRLHLEGKYPQARYMSLISYDFKGAPLDAVADYLFTPTAGSTNPFNDGADRMSRQRGYRIEVVNEERATPMRWGVHLKGETRDRIHAPQQADSTQQQLQYRISARDKGTDETANGGLPEPVLTLADGSVLRGPAVCAQLRTGQPLAADLGALALPREALGRQVEEAKKKFGPAGPATNPPIWSKTSQETSRFAMYTGDFKVEADVRRRDGSFHANLDNQSVHTMISVKFGDVWVMRAKAPTTPRTFNGDARWSDAGELRYWSWCSNQGFGTARVNACVFDEEGPVDAQGFYTLVMSRAADRPRNAIPECGVAWLPMADVGDGTGEPDLSILLMRQMLGAGQFKHALHGIRKQEDVESGMGPYFPRGRYLSVSAFATARPCLIEKL